ncbi:MAG: sugar phosphate nucleotidyltransferase [Ferruginibacter sp.]|nr:sugar phosphate nucleotidyltransferase [Ferruginibacter sp.]
MPINFSNSQYLILAAGRINYLNLPVNTNSSNSMIPINGKPVIAWILENLMKKKPDHVYIVTRRDDLHLNSFLNRAFSNKLNLTIIALDKTDSIVDSLKCGLENVDLHSPVNILLGDTLIADELPDSPDSIFVHEVEDSSRWCLTTFDNNGNILDFIDKQPNRHGTLHAACGFYCLADTDLLFRNAADAQLAEERQLSDVLNRYKSQRSLQIIMANQWFDFGNIDNLIKAKQQLLQSRYFNTLTINPLLNTITKVSEFDKKLRNELNWYEEIPERLMALIPRIVSKQEHNGKLHMVQEYYGYPNLAELYLYSDMSVENWHSVMKKLLLIHSEFLQHTTEVKKEDYHDVYQNKTFERLEALSEDQFWKELLKKDEVYINGICYKNLPLLQKSIIEQCNKLVENATSSLIHGDFCLSNILYDINSQITKLIDPRGSFGSRGIYGDPRYDMAKLRHSIAGNYDFIVSDLFKVTVARDQFQYEIYVNDNSKEIANLLDEMLTESGYSINEIKFIESLLFISMLPLHKDKPERQKMMFIEGIKLMNEIFNSDIRG